MDLDEYGSYVDKPSSNNLLENDCYQKNIIKKSCEELRPNKKNQNSHNRRKMKVHLSSEGVLTRNCDQEVDRIYNHGKHPSTTLRQSVNRLSMENLFNRIGAYSGEQIQGPQPKNNSNDNHYLVKKIQVPKQPVIRKSVDSLEDKFYKKCVIPHSSEDRSSPLDFIDYIITNVDNIIPIKDFEEKFHQQTNIKNDFRKTPSKLKGNTSRKNCITKSYDTNTVDLLIKKIGVEEGSGENDLIQKDNKM